MDQPTPGNTTDARSKSSPANSKSKLNHVVFWPPFLLLIAAVVLNFTNQQWFSSVTNAANRWVLNHFGFFFLAVGATCLILCLVVCVSPFGGVRLGGKDAKPLLKMWNWFAITVCTTIAVGILLWSTSEPIMHLMSPPASKQMEPGGQAAAKFAMETMYLHWTFTPYAIYAVASLMFAFTYYNMRKPYCLGSPIAPLIGDSLARKSGNLIDAICLYSLVAGMAASLGSGILVLADGIHQLIPDVDSKSAVVRAIIAAVIIATFIVSSATGLMKGIRILSSINTYALMALAVFVLVFGPTAFILSFGFETFSSFLLNFFSINLFTFTDFLAPQQLDADGTPVAAWTTQWTIFYWAVWMAWTPITACFLGSIAYGRTVREFMLVNFLLPALFGAAWMAIFSGSALHLEMESDAGFATLLEPDAAGKTYPERVAYALFGYLPLTIGLVIFYVVSSFICFVTSADSNTTAMAAISSSGITPENSEGGLAVKIAWGITVGLVAWVMITFADIEGIKIISTLGGFPAAILLVLVLGSLVKVLFNYKEYNIVDRESGSS
ncbi:BCCT family transporter [Mariniblastus sp.]|nr:BCCT family transporter [Mariniblastus sp.]